MADLTDREIRNILKNHGEDIGPITPSTRDIYVKRIQNLEKSNQKKQIRKSEPVYPTKVNWSPPKINAPKTPIVNNNNNKNIFSTPQDLNIRKESSSNAGIQTVNSYGSLIDSSAGVIKYANSKSPDPILINKSDRKPRNSLPNSENKLITDDNYSKNLKERFISPISTPKTYEKNYYRPTTEQRRSNNYINPLHHTETICAPQVNVNNKKWYNGSLNSISNYFVKNKENDDLMDISDADLSDNESNLMTRLRKNYFKKPSSSDVNNSKLKSKTAEKKESFLINSNHLPNILLVAFIIFSIVMFSSYLMMKSRYSHMELDIAIDKLICKDTSRQCFTKPEMLQLRKYLAKLYEILSEHAGEKTCQFIANKKVPFSKARDMLNHKLTNEIQEEITDKIWSDLMKLVLWLPRDKLEIIGYSNDNKIIGFDGLPEQITYLECLKPRRSLICRFKMSLVNIMNWILYIFIILLIIITVFIVGYFLNLYRLKLKDIKERHISELKEVVSNISALLQDQLRQAECSPSSDKFIPLTKIRSILQQTYPKLRDNRFWDDVKKFMYKSEPLIEIKETIAHGEILEWKSCLGWQGSAVQSEHEVKFERGPTECLKIRNMNISKFCTFNESSQNYLRREVMNHIKDAGEVLDIKFLTKGQQVIVYVMCASREVAGRAFRKINANYFNGNLLNVKFIRMDKYLERFPESKIYVK